MLNNWTCFKNSLQWPSKLFSTITLISNHLICFKMQGAITGDPFLLNLENKKEAKLVSFKIHKKCLDGNLSEGVKLFRLGTNFQIGSFSQGSRASFQKMWVETLRWLNRVFLIHIFKLSQECPMSNLTRNQNSSRDKIFGTVFSQNLNGLWPPISFLWKKFFLCCDCFDLHQYLSALAPDWGAASSGTKRKRFEILHNPGQSK